jgi:hypothetical protein
VPEHYGPWPTVYRLFATWQRLGVWTLMVKLILALLDTAGLLEWIVRLVLISGEALRPLGSGLFRAPACAGCEGCEGCAHPGAEIAAHPAYTEVA